MSRAVLFVIITPEFDVYCFLITLALSLHVLLELGFLCTLTVPAQYKPSILREKVLLSRLKCGALLPDGQEKSCGNVSVAKSKTLITVPLSYHESRAIQTVEGYFADSPTSVDSSSFVFHYTENGSLFNLQACLLVQRNPLPNHEVHQPDDSGWVCVSTKIAPSMYGWLFS